MTDVENRRCSSYIDVAGSAATVKNQATPKFNGVAASAPTGFSLLDS